jgi:DNA-binding beta-propeller fold protein YncE
MTSHTLARMALAAAVAAGIAVLREGAAHAQGTRAMPRFDVDATWPSLPNNWVLGQVPGIAVDRHDHVWILHRPRTVPEEQRSRAAPAVLEFDDKGTFVAAWGGPGAGFDWPDSEHGITVDQQDNVWIGGSSPTSNSLTRRSDDMLLKFTSKGKFLLQIGGPDKSGGNKDTASVNKPADAYVSTKTNEVFVADGYGNRRVIVFDAGTGAFKRMWGAFGNVPVDAPAGRGAGAPPAVARAGGSPGAGAPPAAGRGAAPPLETEGPGPQQFGGPVHSVKISNDGLLYVADRANRRVQVFDPDGKYKTQMFVNRAGPSSNSVAGIAFSPDGDQRFMYLADYGNSRIVVVERKSLDVLYQFGNLGEKPGDFRGPHHLAADSKGNIYVAEVSPGNRAQRFVYKGTSSATPPNALTAQQLAVPAK